MLRKGDRVALVIEQLVFLLTCIWLVSLGLSVIFVTFPYHIYIVIALEVICFVFVWVIFYSRATQMFVIKYPVAVVA